MENTGTCLSSQQEQTHQKSLTTSIISIFDYARTVREELYFREVSPCESSARRYSTYRCYLRAQEACLIEIQAPEVHELFIDPSPVMVLDNSWGVCRKLGLFYGIEEADMCRLEDGWYLRTWSAGNPKPISYLFLEDERAFLQRNRVGDFLRKQNIYSPDDAG